MSYCLVSFCVSIDCMHVVWGIHTFTGFLYPPFHSLNKVFNNNPIFVLYRHHGWRRCRVSCCSQGDKIFRTFQPVWVCASCVGVSRSILQQSQQIFVWARPSHNCHHVWQQRDILFVPKTINCATAIQCCLCNGDILCCGQWVDLASLLK